MVESFLSGKCVNNITYFIPISKLLEFKGDFFFMLSALMILNNVMSHELVELMAAGIELLMKHLLTSTLYNLE